MKILWLCNIRLPHISEYLGQDSPVLGGWLTGMSNGLMNSQEFELVVLFPNGQEIISGKTSKMKFYGFSNQNTEEQFGKILDVENPDIIHIFGTEFKHALDMVNASEKLGLIGKTVISIQGLVSIIAKHYTAGLPQSIVNTFTFRDFLRQDNIRQQAQLFEKRGKNEVKALQKAKHVIGRTEWDKACVEQISLGVRYHFCNETLRDSFYNQEWGLEHCEKHSIFISQANYPIKGFHLMLEAMPEILKKYSDAHIYVTGKSFIGLTTIEKIKQTSYNKYLAQLIEKYELSNKITFLGVLAEEEFCERLLKTHVFVTPSSIENSPNSLGEAMILGVPSVSSYVGGIPSILSHKEEGLLYQHDAPYMLAHSVCEIFADDKLAMKFSARGRERARVTYDRELNLNRLEEIYKDIQL